MDIDAKDIQNHGLTQKTNGHGALIICQLLIQFY